MKPKELILACLLLLLTSCTKRFFAPALLNNDVSYLAKPASFDSSRHAGYVSGALGIASGSNNNDGVFAGNLELSQGHTFKHFNLAYGTYGFAGGYFGEKSSNTVTTTSFLGSRSSTQIVNPYPVGNKSVYGGGLRFSANLYKKIDDVDLRYLGIEAHYSREFGDYLNYRKKAYQMPDYFVSTNATLLTAGFTSEVLFHSPNYKTTQHAFRLFVGRTLGAADRLHNVDGEQYGYTLQTVLVAISYNLTIQRFTGTAETTFTQNSMIASTSLRLKMGYRF